MNPFKTFFYSLKRSVFDPKYYKDIAKSSFWFSFKYLLCLFFFLVFFRAVFFGATYIKNRPLVQPEINKIYKVAKNFYPEKLELRIKKGELSTNVEEPYVFDVDRKSFQTGKHLLIIDTKGYIDNYQEYNTYVLATKNAVVYPSKSSNDNITQTSVFYFKDINQDLTINKQIYDSVLNTVKPYESKAIFFIDWIVYCLLFLFMIFGPLVAASSTLFGLIFLTFFVWIINLIFKKKFSYGTLYRFGMHASTFPILVVETVKLLKLPFSGFYSPLFIIWMVIIIFSQKNKK